MGKRFWIMMGAKLFGFYLSWKITEKIFGHMDDVREKERAKKAEELAKQIDKRILELKRTEYEIR